MNCVITGGAGFIGSHLAERVLANGWQVTLLDNWDPFYPETVKRANIAPLVQQEGCTLVEADIRDPEALRRAVPHDTDVIVHLAARAGVRPSIADPLGYQDTNLRGTQNLLELARERGIRQFVFASSSSVYGINPNTPWSEEDCVLLPISPYASTKVSGELLGHVYSHLYGIRFIALRFFTVYGPRQRPDLAIHKFARRMLNGEPIPVFGDGSTRRDYTYIDDIVTGVAAAMKYDRSDYEVVNLGNNRTIGLMEMIHELEAALGVTARLQHLPPQPGDVPQTWANIDKAGQLLGYRPTIRLSDGLERFVAWIGGARKTSDAVQAARNTG